MQWVYDTKGDYGGTTSYTIEGTSRTIQLKKENELGRPAYVKHPAGATFYNYDIVGRVVAMVQYEATLPAPTSLAGSAMKATELTYFDSTGELATMRYPSGRKVEHRYGALGFGANEDRRGPSEVLIRVDPNGSSTIQRIASAIQYDVDGVPIQWTWGTDQTSTGIREHIRTRDVLGRITKIKDSAAGPTAVAELEYLSYDDDGDVGEIVDRDVGRRSILTQSNTVDEYSWDINTDAKRDILTRWFDSSGIQHDLTIDDDNAHRVSETADGQSYPYTYAGEWAVLRDVTSGVFNYDFRIGTTTSGDTTFLDWKNDGSSNYEVASIGYGSRGDLTTYTLSGGVTTLARDERMMMWSRTGTGLEHRYRYSPSGELIDRREVTGNASRDEYIYLAGMPIGATHTDSTYPSPVSWWLSPDAGGTPRRVFERTSTMRQKIRLIMGAFGDGFEKDDSDIISGIGVVRLPFRHAGQLAETGSPFMVENRWRMYQPELGVYLSPDPDHRVSARIPGGPQAYVFASAQPLKFSDATGRLVSAAFDLASKTLTMVNIDTGNTIVRGFHSGGTYQEYNETGELEEISYSPVPLGMYDILTGPNGNGFFRLEARDSPYGDDEHNSSGRTAFRLHQPGGSQGCVTAITQADWDAVTGMLGSTSTDEVEVRSRNWLPRCDQKVTRFGYLTVRP